MMFGISRMAWLSLLHTSTDLRSQSSAWHQGCLNQVDALGELWTRDKQHIGSTCWPPKTCKLRVLQLLRIHILLWYGGPNELKYSNMTLGMFISKVQSQMLSCWWVSWLSCNEGLGLPLPQASFNFFNLRKPPQHHRVRGSNVNTTFFRAVCHHQVSHLPAMYRERFQVWDQPCVKNSNSFPFRSKRNQKNHISKISRRESKMPFTYFFPLLPLSLSKWVSSEIGPPSESAQTRPESVLVWNLDSPWPRLFA